MDFDLICTVVENIIDDPKKSKNIAEAIQAKTGLYDESIWTLIPRPEGRDVLDIGSGTAYSSCHLAKDNNVTVVEPYPFNDRSISGRQAIELMSLIYYSQTNERMPSVDYIKNTLSGAKLGQAFDQAYFFFPDPELIGQFPMSIIRDVSKSLKGGGSFTIVSENELDIPDCTTEKHIGKRGRLTQKEIEEFAWHVPVYLPDYDLNIITYRN